MEQSIRNSAIWIALGNGYKAISGVLQLVVISNFLNTTNFAIVSISIAIFALIQSFTESGFSTVLIRFRDATDDEKSSVYWLNALFGAIFAISLSLFAPLLSNYYRHSDISVIIYICSSTIFINTLFLQIRISNEKVLNFSSVILVESIGITMVTFTACYLAFRWQTPLCVAVGQLFGSATQLFGSWIFLTKEWRPKLHFRLRETKRFLRFGTDMLALSAVTALTVQLDVLLGAKTMGVTTFGLFAQPRDLALKIMQAINPIVTRIGLPVMAKNQNDALHVGKLYLMIVRLSATVCFPLYGALALFGPHVLPSLVGDRWIPAMGLLPYIAAWFSIRSILNPFGTYLAALGKARSALRFQLMFAITILGAVGTLAPYGPKALAVGMAGVYLIFFQLAWVIAIRPTSRIKFLDYQMTFIGPLLATFMTIIYSGVVLNIFGNSLVSLCTVAVTALPIYFIMSCILNKIGIQLLLGRHSRASSSLIFASKGNAE